MKEAKARGMNVMFSILWTPGWAGGGATGNGNRAPTNMAWLQSFAIAAATRYSGTYPDPHPPFPGATLPRVRYWTAWNEPNAPLFLKPQYKRLNGRWVVWSGRVYAKMCSAVFRGVHKAEALTGVSRGKVACGVTNPGGNNHPRGRRPAPTPDPLRPGDACREADVRRLRTPSLSGLAFESPSEPPSVRARITLGNLGVLIRELNRLGWGTKRVWLTEYGYQTKPPDGLFGVTPTNQAAYMRQAYKIAKENRRVDMFVWFLLKDELEVNRWQSGLIWSGGTREGVKKPAYLAFKALRG